MVDGGKSRGRNGGRWDRVVAVVLFMLVRLGG